MLSTGDECSFYAFCFMFFTLSLPLPLTPSHINTISLSLSLTHTLSLSYPPSHTHRVLPIIDDPEFTFERMKTKSAAAANLCNWVVNIIRFNSIYKRVKPLMDSLGEGMILLFIVVICSHLLIMWISWKWSCCFCCFY